MFFSTANRRNQAQNAVESARVAPRWGVDTITTTPMYGTTLPCLSVQIRFLANADAQAAYTQLETAFTNQQAQPGSVLTLHTCTHDEATNSCLVVNSRSW